MTFPLFVPVRAADPAADRRTSLNLDAAPATTKRRPTSPTGTLVQYGFTEGETRAWVGAASYRFTPFTAAVLRHEGFGPDDAALWSESTATRC